MAPTFLSRCWLAIIFLLFRFILVSSTTQTLCTGSLLLFYLFSRLTHFFSFYKLITRGLSGGEKEAAPLLARERISNEEFRHELAIIAVYFVPGPRWTLYVFSVYYSPISSLFCFKSYIYISGSFPTTHTHTPSHLCE